MSLTLAERLGFDAGDRVVVVHADDIGMCHAANLGAFQTLREGPATCGSIMVPCPWFQEAAEFAKACNGEKCRLPTAVSAISRQGVSMQLPQRMFDYGTGIREVDAFIHAINPNGHKIRPRIYSPDMPSRRHRITTGFTKGQWP
jgi:hypothetical protein